MINWRVRLAGFFAGLTVNHESIGFTFRMANRPWSILFVLVRKLLRVLHLADRTTILAQHPPMDLPDDVSAVEWYHTIDLGDGVVTPGVFDHRPMLPYYQLPDRLDGLRVLDVATWDGFWAFEFERRGAKEVVALDIPSRADVDATPAVRRRMMEADADSFLGETGQGFKVAHQRLGSSVERRTLSVYDLSPDALGMFDVVHIGDLLLHLKYPLRALQNMLSVTSGYAIISEAYYPELHTLGKDRLARYTSSETDFIWWEFSLEALQHMIYDAGFEKQELKNTFPFAGLLRHAVIQAFPPQKT